MVITMQQETFLKLIMRGNLLFIKYNLEYSADERLSVALLEGLLCFV